eukprot:TRINITY_DN527_c0_g1_i1.p1 TRINITY_DN527_c0_g1~~TRINITY_DN527_c0_g1_i1.p1  ORF type:complete len:223 (-),score=-54.76 TRINITY_DN527_c0_g1_i1:43-711(-)
MWLGGRLVFALARTLGAGVEALTDFDLLLEVALVFALFQEEGLVLPVALFDAHGSGADEGAVHGLEGLEELHGVEHGHKGVSLALAGDLVAHHLDLCHGGVVRERVAHHFLRHVVAQVAHVQPVVVLGPLCHGGVLPHLASLHAHHALGVGLALALPGGSGGHGGPDAPRVLLLLLLLLPLLLLRVLQRVAVAIRHAACARAERGKVCSASRFKKRRPRTLR